MRHNRAAPARAGNPSGETLSPGVGGTAFSDGLVMYRIGRGGLAVLATPGRGGQGPVLTVGCEDTVEACQIDPQLGHQCAQATGRMLLRE